MILVTGAGGFIGGHLVRALLSGGEDVRAVDVKPRQDWHQIHAEAHNAVHDLRDRTECEFVMRGATRVYNLAADMGGMGFIESHKADCMVSVLINTHLLMAAAHQGVDRYFYSSSACVYGQGERDAVREDEAYPAHCEDGYGWEKLFSERMCRHFAEDYGVPTRVARLHNVYGPHGTWDGGREKAPAAICRKVAAAVRDGSKTIEVWGDGQQVRSFMHVDDCVRGILLISDGEPNPAWMRAPTDPINLGSEQAVTIDRLIDAVEKIAGVRLKRLYDHDAPKGVRSRNSDNGLIRSAYGWEPLTRLEDGLAGTYSWIAGEVARAGSNA